MKLRKLAFVLSLTCASTSLAEDSVQDVWKAKCKSCHGEDGKANTKVGKKEKMDDLTDPKWHARHSDEEIRDVITNGDPDNKKMKAFKDKLTAEQIDALVKHVRNFKQ